MYSLNKRKMFCDITDDFTVVINSETGIYYGINGFGSAVFQWIVKGASVQDILVELNKISGIPADIEQRLTAFVQDLREKEIIVEAATIKNEIKINEAAAIDNEFTFDVSTFDDAQELLLSDPIHDVAQDTGWQPILKIDE
ncbi:MAG: PqqD family protein [Paludibacter sp.]|jgi:hypothetical protein|nr:PqqD family protein [Paludibacter sp.]